MTDTALYNARVASRAAVLQAEGPDEYPFGYYVELAKSQMAEERFNGGDSCVVTE